MIVSSFETVLQHVTRISVEMPTVLERSEGQSRPVVEVNRRTIGDSSRAGGDSGPGARIHPQGPRNPSGLTRSRTVWNIAGAEDRVGPNPNLPTIAEGQEPSMEKSKEAYVLEDGKRVRWSDLEGPRPMPKSLSTGSLSRSGEFSMRS